jgi:hypothetical protein
MPPLLYRSEKFAVRQFDNVEASTGGRAISFRDNSVVIHGVFCQKRAGQTCPSMSYGAGTLMKLYLYDWHGHCFFQETDRRIGTSAKLTGVGLRKL